MASTIESKKKKTTVAASTRFAEVAMTLARNAGQPIHEFLDSDVLPHLVPRFRKVLRQKLKTK